MDPLNYRIIIEGEIGPRYAAAFDGMKIRAAHGETEITAPITTNRTYTDCSAGSRTSDSHSAASRR